MEMGAESSTPRVRNVYVIGGLMKKAKPILMFTGAVVLVMAFAPIALAFADKLTGGAVGNVLSSAQGVAASGLGVASTTTEVTGSRIIAD